MEEYFKKIVALTAEQNIKEIKSDLISQKALEQLYSLEEQGKNIETELKKLRKKVKKAEKK